MSTAMAAAGDAPSTAMAVVWGVGWCHETRVAAQLYFALALALALTSWGGRFLLAAALDGEARVRFGRVDLSGNGGEAGAKMDMHLGIHAHARAHTHIYTLTHAHTHTQ